MLEPQGCSSPCDVSSWRLTSSHAVLSAVLCTDTTLLSLAFLAPDDSHTLITPTHCDCLLTNLQKRALTTYFRRIYHPFLQRQPSLHTVSSGMVMIWTHTQPAISDTGKDPAVLAVAVVIPTLADLTEALVAVQDVIVEQGVPYSTSQFSWDEAVVVVTAPPDPPFLTAAVLCIPLPLSSLQSLTHLSCHQQHHKPFHHMPCLSKSDQLPCGDKTDINGIVSDHSQR